MGPKCGKMRMAVTNQYCFHENVNRSLNSGNICFHSVKNLLFCRLLCKRAKIVILGYKNTVLRIVISVCAYILKERTPAEED